MKTAKKILNNKMAMIGLFIVSIIVFFGLFGPMIASHDPMEMDLYNIGAAPNDDHIWGTDEMGRDIFSRVIVGARTSLIIGVAVVFIGCGAGILIGLICGYFGGIIDGIVMKIMDVLMAFPTILLSLFFITILGIGTIPAVIGVGLATIPRFARLVRGSVLSIKEKEYFEAEKAVGQRDVMIMLKHVPVSYTHLCCSGRERRHIRRCKRARTTMRISSILPMSRRKQSVCWSRRDGLRELTAIMKKTTSVWALRLQRWQTIRCVWIWPRCAPALSLIHI